MNFRIVDIMFRAPWWSIAINPHYLPRRALYGAMMAASGNLSGEILDVGCGVQPYKALLGNANVIVGLELDTAENRKTKSADVYYDGRILPFDDNTFDGVLCNQVLEHVFEPTQFLSELARVLKPGGRLVLSVPFIWPEHEIPWDSQRFTSFGLAHVITGAGFEILHQEQLVPGGAALCAIVADRINGVLSPLPLPLRIALRSLLVAPWSIAGACLLCFLGSSRPSLFLDNFVVAATSDGGKP